MGRRRLDQELVARGLVPSVEEAAALIEAREVLVDGSVALKGAHLIGPGSSIALEPAKRFASRAGRKLDGILDEFAIEVNGRKCLDAGAGHGGFTSVLIGRGASAVVAVDVGYGQFDFALRQNPKVLLMERTNLRKLSFEASGAPFDLILSDLSFISLASIVPKLSSWCDADGEMLLLVKPQFEAPAESVPAGGVVRNSAVWRQALGAVSSRCELSGMKIRGVLPSPVRGAKGNQEFFLWAGWEEGTDAAGQIEQAIERAKVEGKRP